MAMLKAKSTFKKIVKSREKVKAWVLSVNS